MRRRNRPWVRPLGEIDWFDDSVALSITYLVSLTSFWLGIPAAIAAGRFLHSDRLTTACIIVVAISTWSPAGEASDKARWEFGFRNSDLNRNYFLWLMIGGGVRRAVADPVSALIKTVAIPDS